MSGDTRLPQGPQESSDASDVIRSNHPDILSGDHVRGDAEKTLGMSRPEQELRQLREAGEISRLNLGFDEVRGIYEESGRVIQRSDLMGPDGKERPLVLNAADAEAFREINYIGPDGESCTVDPESMNGMLILLPKHFGNGEWSE